ncbi:unnamed protein product [Dicrocoelium dendriticum]|nr:unnamed protein product [Dicrocoelium dendriticum]
MICSCQALNRYAEALVLSQISPEGSLIDFGLQLISNCSNPATDSVASANEQRNTTEDGKPSQPLKTVDKIRGACGGFYNTVSLECLDGVIEYLWDIRILETLSASAFAQGAFALHSKYNSCITIPDLNSNNPDQVVSDSADARILQFLHSVSQKLFA